MILIRLFNLLLFILSIVTLIQPKAGWGRLALFIPKLFAGSNIYFIGAFGLAGASLAWLISQDVLAAFLGLAAAVIAFRHILRIVNRSLYADRRIVKVASSRDENVQKPMMQFPWIVFWKMPPVVPWERDVSIGHPNEFGEPLLIDLWHPAMSSTKSGLGLIYLHGSGWHYADKDFGTRQFFTHLANQGHVIADLAYTLAPEADLFGMVADVKYAIRWMKTEAQIFGVNPDRIVLMGGSAGGQLALLAAYTPNHPSLDPKDSRVDTSVHGVISYYGPPDLWAQYECFKELPGLTGNSRIERVFMNFLEARFGFKIIPVHQLIPNFLGGTPQDVPELYDLGSPSNHIANRCPPTLLIQGAHDLSGMAPEVRKLHNALKRVGCHSVLLELPDTEHGFDLYRPKWSPAAQAATFVTERFLASLI